MADTSILLGFEVGTGKEVRMKLHHTVITGMTQLSGKCLTGDDLILLQDGSRITVEEAYNGRKPLSVISLGEDLKVTPDRVVEVHRDRVKPVLQVMLRDGRSVKLSTDHPVLSADGWKPIAELKEGDFIAAPRSLEAVEATADAPDSALIILGHMIAEGSLTISRSSAGYTSSHTEMVRDLDAALRRHRMELHKVGDIDYRIRQQSSSLPYSKGARKGSAGCPSVGEWRHFCETYGLEQAASRSKKIPDFVFSLKREKVRLFLNRLFGGDGCYYEKHLVTYASTSHSLLQQIQHLLLRFGINSRHTESKHELRIVRADTNRFLREIGFFGRSFPEREMKHNGTYDVVPVRVPTLKWYKDHWIKAGKRYGFPSRPTLERYASRAGREDLLRLARSDVYWVQIKELRSLGDQQTYDVTTEKTGNLVVNDVFVHNTTTLEAVISRANRRAIAFKTKRGEGGFNSYRELPPFFHQRADWQYVASLLEAVLHEKMRFERPWIMRATKNTTTLREVYENVQMLKADASGTTLAENVYTALEEYLKIVVPQIEKFEFSKVLELGDGINVMDLTPMSPELQSLVVQSTMEYVITNLRDVIVIIPEAWEHLPQGRSTPVKLYAETFIRKGAAIGNYLFIDSQDIAGIDKMPLRQCNNWILGRQREGHEVERVREQLGKKIDADEIRGLGVGQFYAILGDETWKVYVLPVGVPAKVGKRVAAGELPVSEAVRFLEEARSKRQGKQEEAPRQSLLRVLGNRRGGAELERHLSARDEEVQQLRGEVTDLRKELVASNQRVQDLLKKQEASEVRANAVQVPTGRLGFNLDDLNMLVDQRVHQIIKYDRPTILTTVDVSGGFRDVIKERFVQQIAQKIRSLPEQAGYAAMVVHEKQSMDRGDLYSFLTGEQGKIPPEFYEMVRLLEEVKLVSYSKETGLVSWSLREFLDVELHQLYDEDTRRQAEQYLASLLLPSENGKPPSQ